MADYRLIVSRSAGKDFEALPSIVIERVRQKIHSLALDPRPSGSKKLHGRPEWRVRVGDYRILYTINEPEKVVSIQAVSHRSSAYD